MSIMERYNPQSVILTATQKGILAIIYNSPTPETAFESTNGSPALITARNLLERLGLIQIGQNKAILTPNGQQSVVAHNIVDETGNLTDEAVTLIDNINNYKSETNEGFALLKSLIV